MSADNWRVCPQCIVLLDEKIKQSRIAVNEAYGKFTQQQYDAMRQSFEALVDQEVTQKTLREDYELGVDKDGMFSISYAAACDECGFHFKYIYDQDVPLKRS